MSHALPILSDDDSDAYGVLLHPRPGESWADCTVMVSYQVAVALQWWIAVHEEGERH